jgi:lipoprotein-anchoring transpeptidase ErfK/SrfK
VSKHRAEPRPRWGRIGLLSAAALVTLVAVLAGFGIGSGPKPTVASDTAVAAAPTSKKASESPSEAASTKTSPSASSSDAAGSGTAETSASGPASGSGSASGAASGSAPAGATDSAGAPRSAVDATALPAGSGTGRRAVFSQTEQRVWIVGADGKVARTYRVSGSSEDNLIPGTYHVYSKSRWAVGIDDSGVMQYFVRFAHGTDNGASIGFHSIPTKNGKPLQTVAQLGQRLSHGCIRQKTADAIAMWDFADVGTKVVVVA